MRNEGIGSWPARRARKTPDRVALRYDDLQWTYRDLYRRSTRLAHGLRSQGVGPGDRVAYLGPNHPAFLETFFAAGQLGAVFVPLNTRLARAELAVLLDDCAPRVFLDRSGSGPDRYESLVDSGTDQPLDEPVGPDDPCILMYTSGTTGRPKGALLSHGNLTWNALNVLVDADLTSDEVTLLVAPLFHTAGLNMTCLPTLLKGGRVRLEPAFEPQRALDLIARDRVTFMFAVPAMYNAMAAAPGWAGADLSSLRTLMCGGAPVPAATIRAYLARGLDFIQGYGMTEASPGVLLLDRAEVRRKAGTAGVPHFFTDVRVVTPELTDTAPGERGEVVVRGPNVMGGYWQRPEATAAAFTGDGWFRSGDIAMTDTDGFVTIVDRVKDMIISGGENIYPAEVENTLAEHPAVADVAVIGVPDERWGEVGRAIVVLRPGGVADAGTLAGFLADRIARYKQPKSYRFVDALPRNATGKLLKAPLRENYGRRENYGTRADNGSEEPA